jgi:hypothetical protein
MTSFVVRSWWSRRRSTAGAVGLLALTGLVALAPAAGADPGAPTPPSAPTPPVATATAPADPIVARWRASGACDDLLAAGSLAAPTAAPAGGWTGWWAAAGLEAARLDPACTAGRPPTPEPLWRAQVGLRLATSGAARPELAQWLLTSALPPTPRVANPIAALVDAAVAQARAGAPACALTSGQLAAIAWVASPSLVDGSWPLADDGREPAGDAPGLAALVAATLPPATFPPSTVAPATPPAGPATPSAASALARVAAWLCARPGDLAMPDVEGAAVAALLGDGPAVAQAATAAARLGSDPLDPHPTLPRVHGRPHVVRVEGFRVADTVAPSLARLLADAAADGVVLTGGAYRSVGDQVARRRANCAGDDGVADDYDLYEKPSSACSPRTARPGTSLHETGEAVDFEHCQTHDTACFRWLARYAHRYGLANLPEEPWHWSVTGD